MNINKKILVGILAGPLILGGILGGWVSKTGQEQESLVGGSELWKFTSSLLQPVVSTWNVYAPSNIRFDGEIQPDGSTCSNGQILKRTGANDWDCAADAGGVSSNSLDFDEFVTAMTLDVNTTITGGAFALTFDHASVSSTFEVGSGFRVDDTGANGASVSIPFEFTAYASSALWYGGGLQTCNAVTGKFTWSNGLFACGTDTGGSVSSNSLDFDEFVTAMTLDANLTVASTSSNYNINWGGTDMFGIGRASVSRGFTVGSTPNFRVSTINTASPIFAVASSDGATYFSVLSGGGTLIENNNLTNGNALRLLSTGTIVTPGTMFEIVNNTMTTGTGASMSYNALTTGNGLSIQTNGQTSGNNIQLISTGTIVTPGSMLEIRSNTMTTGAVASISATALTTGSAFQIRVPTANFNGTGLLITKANAQMIASIGWGGLEINGVASISGAARFGGAVTFAGTVTGAGGDTDACLNSSTNLLTDADASTCIVSSIRFKKDVKPLDTGLSEVLRLKPVEYVYKNDEKNVKRIGLIAEDVLEVEPRLVFFEQDGVTPRGVTYEESIALLVKAIQDQQKQIDELKGNLRVQEGSFWQSLWNWIKSLFR